MSAQHTPGPSLQEFTVLVETGADHAVADYVERLLDERDALLAALKVSRGQWIHSVNAEQCLAAIAKVEGK